MKILFYLPVVTPWWFDNVVEPLIRRLHGTAEIIVLAPKPWRGTGIGERELARCVDLSHVRWCIMDGDDHPTTRTKPRAAADIIDFVQNLAPDYVFCRSADFETVKAFPGKVRFLMEGGIAPFRLPDRWIMIQEQLLEHAALPQLDQPARDRLVEAIAPAWSKLRTRHRRDPEARTATLAAAGLPADRPVLLLPLEYDHDENFFRMHRVGARPNHRLVQEVAKAVGSRFAIAVTDHPLNKLYVDTKPLEDTVRSLGGQVWSMPAKLGNVSSTLALAPHVDGILVNDSKAFALGPLCGTPILRRSRFPIGDWVCPYTEFEPFLQAIVAGTARIAAEEDARLWTAFHLANNAFDPQDPALTAADILDRADQSVSVNRWDAALTRLHATVPDLFE